MSNFKYVIDEDKCYLLIGNGRIRIRWNKRWIGEGAEVTVVKHITLDKTAITFTNFEGTQTITPTLKPADPEAEFEWASSNELIATVADGVVTPVKYASIPEDPTCTITCTLKSDSSVKATCIVTSNVIVPTSITLNESSVSFTTLDETKQLTATIEPETAIKDVVWSSNNAHVTVSDEGLVTAKSTGDSTITCKSAYKASVKATCSVETNIG